MLVLGVGSTINALCVQPVERILALLVTNLAFKVSDGKQDDDSL